MADLPSVNDMWLKARERYQIDAVFHALVYSTAELLRMPVEHVALPVHAMQLAAELLNLGEEIGRGLAAEQSLRALGQTLGYVDSQGRMTQRLVDDLGIPATVSEDGNDLIPNVPQSQEMSPGSAVTTDASDARGSRPGHHSGTSDSASSSGTEDSVDG